MARPKKETVVEKVDEKDQPQVEEKTLVEKAAEKVKAVFHPEDTMQSHKKFDKFKK